MGRRWNEPSPHFFCLAGPCRQAPAGSASGAARPPPASPAAWLRVAAAGWPGPGAGPSRAAGCTGSCPLRSLSCRLRGEAMAGRPCGRCRLGWPKVLFGEAIRPVPHCGTGRVAVALCRGVWAVRVCRHCRGLLAPSCRLPLGCRRANGAAPGPGRLGGCVACGAGLGGCLWACRQYSGGKSLSCALVNTGPSLQTYILPTLHRPHLPKPHFMRFSSVV